MKITKAHLIAFTAAMAGGGTATLYAVDPAAPAPVYETAPEDFCDGACPGPDGDWAPVFAAMFEACSPTAAPNAPDRYRLRRGCRVRLACDADYAFRQDLVLTRGHLIQGCGLGGGWGNTTLIFYRGGVKLRGPFAQSTLQGLQIKGPVSTSTNSVGVDSEAGLRLRDVFVQGFWMGVNIRGDSTGETTNANNWLLDNVLIQGTGGPGFYVSGADANAGLAVNLNISNTCQAVPQSEACWALRDRSFLGNTYLNPHTAYSGNLVDTYFPQYVIENATSSTLLLNPYQEGQEAGSVLTGTGLALSGRLQNVGDPGFTQIRGRRVAGDLAFNADGWTEAGLGTTVAAMRLSHTNPTVDQRLVFDPGSNTFGWKPAGAGFGELTVTSQATKTGHGLPMKAAWAWQGRNGGWYEGGPTSVIAHAITGDNNPNVTDCGGHPVGSTLRHVRPRAGGPLSWLCLCDAGVPTPQGGCSAGAKSWRAWELAP